MNWCLQFSKENGVFIDAGAHTGTYSVYMANRFAEVHAFEPQPMSYYALCGSVALSGLTNVVCHNLALSDVPFKTLSRLNVISVDGGGSTLENSEKPVLDSYMVPIQQLDSMEIQDVAFMKIDTEGHEVRVLAGSIQTLKHSGWPPVIFECNNNAQDAYELLESLTSYRVHPIRGTTNMFLASNGN
jgi:FkbM family methyltransferase